MEVLYVYHLPGFTPHFDEKSTVFMIVKNVHKQYLIFNLDI